MEKAKILRAIGLLLLLGWIVASRNIHAETVHYVGATGIVMLFWYAHSIRFSITNFKTLFVILLVFAGPFFLIGQLPYFSTLGKVSWPWTGEHFNPSLTGKIQLSHEVALQLYFNHEPTASERYFKTGSLIGTDDGLRYQTQITHLNAALMPETRVWASAHLKPNQIDENVRVIEGWFKKDFRYSLEPGVLSESHPLDEFLFMRKTGYCEHFAASLATLLKLSGIQTRVVVGFAHGSWNPLSRRLTYEMADSHAWVEAWNPTTGGWERLDPTEWVNAIEPSNSALFSFLFSSPKIAYGLLIVLLILPTLFYWCYSSRKAADPLPVFFRKLARFEKKLGLRSAGLTLEERMNRMMNAFPSRKTKIADSLSLYRFSYFKNEPTSELKEALRKSLKNW